MSCIAFDHDSHSKMLNFCFPRRPNNSDLLPARVDRVDVLSDRRLLAGIALVVEHTDPRSDRGLDSGKCFVLTASALHRMFGIAASRVQHYLHPAREHKILVYM